MKIVLTGKMSQTRAQMYRKFDLCGITVMGAVTGTTEYLVTGERPGGNKIATAKAHSVPIYTETEFHSFLLDEYPEFLL